MTNLRLLPAAVVALWFAERTVRTVVPWMGARARGAWASAMRLSASPAARRSAMEAKPFSALNHFTVPCVICFSLSGFRAALCGHGGRLIRRLLLGLPCKEKRDARTKVLRERAWNTNT